MLRRIKQFGRRLLALNDTPERIAFAFALGVFLAFSPLLGLHTVLGLVLAFVFGLNRVAVLFGLLINNPWTIVPIYFAGTYVGRLFVAGAEWPRIPDLTLSRLANLEFWEGLASHWRVLKPLLLGSTILSVIFAAVSYAVALHLIRRGRRVEKVLASSAESCEETPG
jgi:uncharacterized protein